VIIWFADDEVPTSGDILNPSANEGAVANSDETHADTAAAPADVDETRAPSSPHPSPEAKPELSRNLQTSSPELETTDVSSAGATARKHYRKLCICLYSVVTKCNPPYPPKNNY